MQALIANASLTKVMAKSTGTPGSWYNNIPELAVPPWKCNSFSKFAPTLVSGALCLHQSFKQIMFLSFKLESQIQKEYYSLTLKNNGYSVFFPAMSGHSLHHILRSLLTYG